MIPDCTQQVALPAPHRDREELRACMFGLLAAPLGWFLQLCAGYALASWPCFPHEQRGLVPLTGYEWTRAAIGVISLAGILLASAGCLASLRVLRRAGKDLRRRPLERWQWGTERSCFLALWGVVFGSGFALSAMISTSFLLVLPRCAG